MGSTPSTATVESVHVQVLRFPTDAPEADGTLSWDSTTMVVVEARSGGATGLGYTYGVPATAHAITGLLAGIVTGRPVLDVP
ncbi:mandelate racemase, partial [Streptomyces sp. NPDC057757]